MSEQQKLIALPLKRMRESLLDLDQMAAVEELWDEDVLAVRTLADVLEGVVNGTWDSAALVRALNEGERVT